TVHMFTEALNDKSSTDHAFAVEEIGQIMANTIEVFGTYNELYVLNTSGEIIAQESATGWTFGHSIGDDQSTKEYFTACLAQAANVDFTFLSDFRLSSSGEYLQITVSSVIHDEDAIFQGVVVAYLDFHYLENLIHTTGGMGTSGETYLVNYEGYWLTTSNFDYYTTKGGYDTIEETILDAKLPQAGIQMALEQRTNLQNINDDYRGVPVMGSYEWADVNDQDQPWVLVAEIDVSEALAVPNDLMTISIWIVVIVAIIVAILGYVIAKRFTDPIIRLNSSAMKVADGDLTDIGENGKIRKGNDEIAVLGRSFATMTENIRDIIATSQEASINVSNISTELAASSSEVNAAAEEISATTQEVAQSSQSQVDSLV
ncbi:hypothetical protein LCGC14_2963450, partial [marine sediment metagenome]